MIPIPANIPWKLIAVGLLIAALGVQTYRLRDEQADHAILKERVAAAARAAAVQALQDVRNKERTDEEYNRAIARAHAAGVRTAAGRVKPPAAPVTIGGDESTPCFDRGKLVDELAGWVTRDAARLSALIAGVSQRVDTRFTGIARTSEEVAAAARSCAVWAIGLGGRTAPGTPTER